MAARSRDARYPLRSCSVPGQEGWPKPSAQFDPAWPAKFRRHSRPATSEKGQTRRSYRLSITSGLVARVAENDAGAAGGLFLRVEETGQWWNLRGGTLMFYYLALALAVGALALTAWLARTRIGYQWLAVREDEEAARALGINVFRAKMAAILISSGLTAVGGVFTAFYSNNLFPSRVFDINRSIEIILAPIVGGLGTVFGPVVGAFILTPLGEVLTALTDRLGINAPGVKAAFYGLALMVIIVLRPAGVWPWLARVLRLTEHRR